MKRDRRISLDVLLTLWGEYTEFQSGHLAPSTIARDYRKIRRRLERLQHEAPTVADAIAIRNWLLQSYSHEVTRRTLVQVNACFKWAVNSDLVVINPFEGLPQQIRKSRKSERNWAAFTRAERDTIIREFESRLPWLSAWVKFLFWTGARPEEAAALRWEHVAADYSQLLIIEAFPVDMKKSQSTKNYKTTRFPCNEQLQALLKVQCPKKEFDVGAFVFPGKRGDRFDYHNFQTRFWRPMVLELRTRGLVSFYLPQYNCRHTFITEGLKAGISIADMSYLCRVSPEIIHRHYSDRNREIKVPEF